MSAVATAEALATPDAATLHVVERASRPSSRCTRPSRSAGWSGSGCPRWSLSLFVGAHVRHRRRVVDGPRDHGDRRRHLRARVARDDAPTRTASSASPLTRRSLSSGRTIRRVRRVVLIVNPYSSGVTPARSSPTSTAALARTAEVVVRQTERQGPCGRACCRGGGGRGRGGRVLRGRDLQRGDQRRRREGAVRVRAGRRRERVPAGARASRATRSPPPSGSAEALDRGRTISIGLGRVNGRRFCFSAGIGFDAEAVRRIDQRGRDEDGRRAGNAIFAATVVGILFESRLRVPPQLTVEGFGRAACLFVANGRPYTYAGPMPVTIAEDADFGGGLDFAAPREVSPAAAPALAFRGFRGTLAGDPRVLAGHDLDGLEVRCDRPLPLQADGEDLGDVTEATSREAPRRYLTDARCAREVRPSVRRPRSRAPSARG